MHQVNTALFPRESRGRFNGVILCSVSKLNIRTRPHTVPLNLPEGFTRSFGRGWLCHPVQAPLETSGRLFVDAAGWIIFLVSVLFCAPTDWSDARHSTFGLISLKSAKHSPVTHTESIRTRITPSTICSVASRVCLQEINHLIS